MNIGRIRCLVPVLSLALSACGGSSDSEQTLNVQAATANQPPSVTLNGGAREQITAGSTYTDPGASASDAEDGDLSGSIQMQSTLDTSTAGTYRITYTVTDSGGASVSVVRTVEVVATAEPQNSEPQILLNGSDQVQVPLGGTYEEAGASATDAEDGDLTARIEISSTIDVNTVGSYEVTYSVTDAQGATATATRTVEVFQAERAFVHPGVLNTEADFQRMGEKVGQEAEPWFSAWTDLTGYGYAQLGRNPRPLETLIRGSQGQDNFGQIFGDIWASYASVLRWKVTGDERYADQAVRFLDAWSSTLTGLAGGSEIALSGLYAYQFANTAEILSTYEGWPEESQQRFADMLIEVFYPMNRDFLARHNGTCISHYWANWDLANIASAMAIGIFADREDLYQNGLDYLHEGLGNGALAQLMFYRHPGNMGQYQESGRDQGHTTLGVALFGAIAKMAWNQGDDIFAYNDHQLLAMSEYIAKYNLMEEVPYKPYNNCDNVDQKTISPQARGHERPGWALIYNHYQNRLGIAAPWTEKMAEKLQPEYQPGGGDQLGWGTLTESLDPFPVGGAPRGLTSTIQGGEVVLSWWGAAGAESYQLKRADSADGPYSLIATRGADETLTYTDIAFVEGEAYYYQVTAISPEGESEPSNRIAVQTGHQLLMHMTFDDLEEGTAEGVIGKAMVMDGEDDFLEVDGNLFSNLSDFTFAGWVNLDKANAWQRLIDIGANTQRYMTLVPYSGDGRACFIITKLGGAEARDHVRLDERVCGGAPVAGEWMHLAVTLSGETAVLYLNGEEVARNESMILTPAQLGPLDQNWLGRSQYEVDPFLGGRVDDIRLYSGVLTATEIEDLVTMATP